MPANSFAGSSSTCCPRASIASATTACSPARTAPRRSRKRASSWVWPRLRPRKRSRSIRWRRSHSPSLVRAVAAACSSSRPSRPAANHATIQPRLSSQSGSTPHEHGCHITHPHRQTRFSLVKPRPRRRSTGQLPVSAFHSAIGPESHPHRCKREPETHQRPSSPNRHALAPRVHRQHRDQIAIAPASASAPHLPRVPSLEAFGRRPPCKPNRRDGPSSETLHKTGKAHCEHMFSALPPTRTSLDVVVNHRRGRKCESDAGSLPLHVFYKKPCEPVIERPDLLVATAWPPGNSDGALEARFPGMGTQDHAGATDALPST